MKDLLGPANNNNKKCYNNGLLLSDEGTEAKVSTLAQSSRLRPLRGFYQYFERNTLCTHFKGAVACIFQPHHAIR